IYIPTSFRGVKNKGVIKVTNSITINKNVFSTGELDGIEQCMAVKTDKGIVLIVGCSHPNMAHILDAARQLGKVYGVYWRITRI
ncbi:MBL fold metallo-hydrolase, partial [bacterium]|nr:MBL fold metallo-hydrolase [bacterium]